MNIINFLIHHQNYLTDEKKYLNYKKLDWLRIFCVSLVIWLVTHTTFALRFVKRKGE